MYYVIFAAVFLSLQYVANRVYGKCVRKNNMACYVMLVSLAALIFYFVYSKFRLTWNLQTVVFGLLFGLSYCLCFMFQLKAMNTGNVALTSLLLSYSLIIPTIFSLIAYRAVPKFWFYIGLGILAVSLFLIGWNKKESGDRLSVEWWLFSLAAFLFNGLCSVIQTYHQTSNSGNYKNEFMICGMALAFVIGAITVLASLKNKKPEILANFKNGWWIGGLAGVFNALLNLFVMLSVLKVAPSVVFPIICGGSLVITYIISLAAFKEKLCKRQLFGFFLGVGSIILLNI